ncbi:hypothetical protein [Paraconexibacter sp. AEG42_29]|uniref:hypothetical protein n=1 Tax=Paraconexibacter sp. AEG42_29 TaxID=2997339 RepID=UPI00339D3C88
MSEQVPSAAGWTAPSTLGARPLAAWLDADEAWCDALKLRRRAATARERGDDTAAAEHDAIADALLTAAASVVGGW